MDQDSLGDGTGNRRELTFFIETQLTDAHPGVIRLRELRKGVKRYLKRSHLFLYQLDQAKGTIGESIARAIYEDQTENRQGKYKGPRWNFQLTSQIHLIQIIEQPGAPLGQKEKPLKREVGTAHIPGELDTSAIIALLAQVIDQGWQPPPREAYLSPELLNGARGTMSYTSTGKAFPLTVQCEHNNRMLKGPVVFIATEEDGLSIDQCAILLPGDTDQPSSCEWYHLFRFEDTSTSLFLCDQGIHALTEPIFLLRGDYDSPRYWVHEDMRIPVEGGERVALSAIRRAVENTAACFAQALPGYSVFCGTCRREYRPALNKSVLQEASRRGYVTTLCPHAWWCPECERWSTPAERAPRPATNEACAHPRPTGWESKLTNDAQEMNASWPESAQSAPGHLRPPIHPYYDSFQDQHWLPGMLYPPRNPGQLLTPSTGEVQSENRSGDLLLITFLEDCHYDTTGGESDFVPVGTRLVGALDTDQPTDDSVAAIIVNNVTWNITKKQVTLLPPEGAHTQGKIAEEDEAEARRRDEEEDFAGAQAFYARAIIEYEADGWTELDLATLRLKRAGVLLVLKRDSEAASELERAARAFEAQAHNQFSRAVSAHLDYAEQAVDALVPLAMIYLHRVRDAVQGRRVIERLLSLNALIKKRYERKVDLLLYIAECFFTLGEYQEALTYFEQANRFYSQQLANIGDFPHVAPITQHLKKVKEKLHVLNQSHTVRFTVTAKTPDDLEAVLGQLQKGRLTGVEVTKGVTAQRTTKDARSGLVYSANLRILISSGDDSAKA